MASNRFEAKARAAKATALVTAARRNHLTAAHVATSDMHRQALVTLTAVRTPSDETWRMVVRAMASAEAQEASYVGQVA